MRYRVFYTGRRLRLRRREMIQHPPPRVSYVTEVPLQDQPPDHALSNPRRRLIRKAAFLVALKVVRWIGIPHFINPQIPEGIDLVHTPGAFLVNDHPHVIEVDNVSCLAYYDPHIGRGMFRRYLLTRAISRTSCKGFVCMSEASKESLNRVFPETRSKSWVVYPYVSRGKSTQRKDSQVRFLFSSTDFYLKGGRQVLEAFSELPSNASLTILSKQESIGEAHWNLISHHPRITFLEARLSKDDVLKLYSEHHVLVVPSLMDSFGMVFLEAVANGLAVIATDLFAIPEMIRHGENGFLIVPPIKYFTKENLPNAPWWSAAKIRNSARAEELRGFKDEIKDAMKKYCSDPQLALRHAERSNQLYEEKFSEQQRKRALEYAYQKALQVD